MEFQTLLNEIEDGKITDNSGGEFTGFGLINCIFGSCSNKDNEIAEEARASLEREAFICAHDGRIFWEKDGETVESGYYCHDESLQGLGITASRGGIS